MRKCIIKFSHLPDEVEGHDYPGMTDEELVEHWTEGWVGGNTVRFGTVVHSDPVVPESVRLVKS